jgi:hypothetical protein
VASSKAVAWQAQRRAVRRWSFDLDYRQVTCDVLDGGHNAFDGENDSVAGGARSNRPMPTAWVQPPHKIHPGVE